MVIVFDFSNCSYRKVPNGYSFQFGKLLLTLGASKKEQTGFFPTQFKDIDEVRNNL
jgi:hypothetical protein